MLARFGWAVIMLAKEHVRTPRAFDFSAEDDDENHDDKDEDGDVDEDEDEDEDGEDENDGGGSRKPRKKLKTSHTKKMPTRRSSCQKKAHLEPEVIQGMLLVACIEYDTD
jgi:hypothetical protein